MEHFDFMSHADLRTELESDLTEMNQCLDIGAWKGVHVLAGSIIEAMIIDHLISEKTSKEIDALKLTLEAALKICSEKKILQEKTIQLTSVIKSYRNLIHPGRVVRLEESASKESAEIAVALVKMVLKDITTVRMAKYGHTAEQIVRKLHSDSSSRFIIDQLLAKMHNIEIKRLLRVKLPERFVEAMSIEAGEDELNRYATCFQIGYELLDDNEQLEIMQWLAKIFREESQTVISSYPIYFLRAFNLYSLEKDDQDLIKNHLLGQLNNDSSEALIKSLSGIASFLAPHEVNPFLDPLVHAACRKNSKEAASIIEYIAVFSENEEVLKGVSIRLHQWVDLFKEHGSLDQVAKAETLKAEYEIYLT